MPELTELLHVLSTRISIWSSSLVALAMGSAVGYLIYGIYTTSLRKSAESEASELLQEAKDAAELRLLEEKERTQEIEAELWAKDEKQMLQTEERIEELEELVQEKKQKADNRYSQERQKTVQYENEVREGEKQIQAMDLELQKIKSELQKLTQDMAQKLASQLGTTPEQANEELISQLIQESEKRAYEMARELEEDVKEHSEQMAKEILDTALTRFARPYSAERGIAPVYFETPEQRRNLIDEKGENIKTLEAVTGCDIIVEEGMEMIGVAGFDPVRRELTRRTLERCLKEKKPLTPDSIRRISENQKREILGQIKRDGDNLAKELKLEGVHPEIRQMMGSLRFRYSFTQNQYFHCGEVGWLAGLLASELRSVDIKKARRSGMLHDLGKAMDHEMDGGHAVIGADFIAKRNEAPDVIHAVKAHHYDEQPSTDMAFLVIAADAISGARPGARRSTIESYNQKVTELEAIARSFDGVTDCYILSGGRECRVMVNSRKVDDTQALKLSHEIAQRIENECNYPGQIKVVVVRETLVSETTRAHA
ncbi:MAG: Rnase Y domain-containing protein [Pseudobdellovibrionaceae bacterium]